MLLVWTPARVQISKSIAAMENTSCRGQATKDPEITSNDEYPIVPSLQLH